MGKSSIEWTDVTWNPVTGCNKVSPGCKNCYAEKMHKRLKGMGQTKYQQPFLSGAKTHDSELELPLSWKKPKRVFVNSMSDLFHEDVPFGFIHKVFDIMWSTPQHNYQILTKRPDRLLKYIDNFSYAKDFGWTAKQRTPMKPGDIHHWDDIRMRNKCGYLDNQEILDVCTHHKNEETDTEHSCTLTNCPIYEEVIDKKTLKEIGLDHQYEFDEEGFTDDSTNWMELHGRPLHAACGNVWLGFSAEDQKTFDERIGHFIRLRSVLGPHFILFLSLEPLLGPIDISKALVIKDYSDGDGPLFIPVINWVIVGGESGSKARPIHPDWVRSLRDQCTSNNVAFFFKQWGEYHTSFTNSITNEPSFRMFTSMQQWINKASTWVNGGKTISIDGRICTSGKDFSECAYPVAIMHKVGKKKSGRILDGKEYTEYPKTNIDV